MHYRLFYLIIILLGISTGVVRAQESVPFEKDAFPGREKELRQAKKQLKKGDRLFESGLGYYQEAADHYVKAYVFNPDNATLNYQLGVCYFRTNKKEKAGKYLKKAYQLNPDVKDNLAFILGEYYQYQSEFDKAIEMYQSYRKKLPPEKLENERQKIDKHIKECEYAKELVGKPVRVFIDHLSGDLNSAYPDYGPVVNADESVLFFTTRRPSVKGSEHTESDFGYMEDILIAERDRDGSWSVVRNPGKPLNSDEHDAIVGITPDGQQLFLYKASGGGDLYYSRLDGNQWRKPKKLSNKVNSKYHESYASFSYDGKRMFYVSDMPDGYGQHDIYMSELSEKGKWQEGKNLGAVINTPYDETAVFMHPDGKTLYFSSTGHSTMGGYDIFKSEFSDGEWSDPENLGYPLNTPGDDVFITLSASGKHAYISSVRPEGKGDQDIYLVTFLGPEKGVINTSEDQLIAYNQEPVTQTLIEEAVEVETTQLTLMKGIITDKKTGEPLQAEITLTNVNTNEQLTSFTSNSETGKYLVTLPAGKNYGIAVRADGYLFYSENIDLREKSGYREIEKNIALDQIEIGKSIVLRNIFFDSGKSTLRDESQAELDRLYEIMDENPGIRVEISGHTDNVGSASFNKKLSEARAKAVVDYLVDKGIDAGRLEYAGYGFEKPIASNDTEEGRQKNRRTEFKIIAK